MNEFLFGVIVGAGSVLVIAIVLFTIAMRDRDEDT